MRSEEERSKRRNWAIVLRWAKKLRAVNFLGGKCERCGETDIRVLDFHHHNNDKEFWFNQLKSYRWSRIENEMKKCILLCRNCHATIENEKRIAIDKRGKTNKKIFLEYVGSKNCSRCGYTGNIASLVFHHRNPEEKKFEIPTHCKRLHSIKDLQDDITEELNKCDLLCQNCHQIVHIDNERFEKYKDIIYEKQSSYYEGQKIDHDEVIKLHEEGLPYSKIMKKLGIKNKSNISYIVNGYRKNKNICQ